MAFLHCRVRTARQALLILEMPFVHRALLVCFLRRQGKQIVLVAQVALMHLLLVQSVAHCVQQDHIS